MPTPELKWIAYTLKQSSNSPLRALQYDFTAAPAAEPAVAPVEFADAEDFVLELPDLTFLPDPREKLQLLLHTAAEIEHALLTQYLYATYSLKGSAEVGDPTQRALLEAWRRTLLGIAREEMGHLMSVQNLLLFTGLPLNLEREDFPPQKDLYPFPLHLEPLTQTALAKYVVAESPLKADNIQDIVTLATGAAGAPVNHVGVLYALLGVVLSRQDELEQNASGGQAWYEMVRLLAEIVHREQGPPEAWHLPDAALVPESVMQQANNEDWGDGAGVRVHLVGDRKAALEALRDIGEQGEGPTTGDGAPSHFQRFLGMFRGDDPGSEFPAPDSWVPARAVPTDPNPTRDFTDIRTRRWAELFDLHYAMLLGYLEHYLLAAAGSLERTLFAGWVFAEMRSRMAPLAMKLTELPRDGTAGVAAGVAAAPFTLPPVLHLPTDESERWRLHRERLEQSVDTIEAMQSADATDAADDLLTRMLTTDQARLEYAKAREGGASPDSQVRFARDILALFGPIDIGHMITQLRVPFPLGEHAFMSDPEVSQKVLVRVTGSDPFKRRMPPPPAVRWTRVQTALFERWRQDGHQP